MFLIAHIFRCSYYGISYFMLYIPYMVARTKIFAHEFLLKILNTPWILWLKIVISAFYLGWGRVDILGIAQIGVGLRTTVDYCQTSLQIKYSECSLPKFSGMLIHARKSRRLICGFNCIAVLWFLVFFWAWLESSPFSPLEAVGRNQLGRMPLSESLHFPSDFWTRSWPFSDHQLSLVRLFKDILRSSIQHLFFVIILAI